MLNKKNLEQEHFYYKHYILRTQTIFCKTYLDYNQLT